MIRSFRLSTIGLFATVGLVLATNAPARSGAPPKLEGMSYLSARPIILGYGWRPAVGNCQGGATSPAICARYPEINNCSGSSPGYCDLKFSRGKRCLVVLLTEGPPSRSSTVDDITFTNSPCVKS